MNENLEPKPEPQIWIDADACPVAVKETVIKASQRLGVHVTFVANMPINVPALQTVKSIQTTKDFDAADDYIAEHANPGDLVVTQDIPLSNDCISQNIFVLSPRGMAMTKENIKAKLNMRDFMETMRSSGVHTGGPSQYSAKDKQQFANQLDRWLTKNYKKRSV